MFPVQKSRESNLTTRETRPLDLFRRQFDQLWDSWLAPFGLDFGQTRSWDFDVMENGKEVVVRAATPGFEEKDLDVRLDNDVLTISAQKEQKDGGEERYQSFFRSITLPHGIDAEKAQATYRNGVLELHLPRPEAVRGTRIPIQGQQSRNDQTGQPVGTADQK